MDKVLATVVVFALIALAITGMVIAWRKRVARDSRFQIVAPGAAPLSHSKAPAEFSGLYVAT